MKEEQVVDMAKKYDVEPGTILLSYLVARGIPGTSLPIAASLRLQSARG